MTSEALFRALADVGEDLIYMAETRRFAQSPWRKWVSLAACLALVVSLGVLALPYFPMGCGSSAKQEMATTESVGAPEETKAEAYTTETVTTESESMEMETETEETVPEDVEAETQQDYGLILDVAGQPWSSGWTQIIFRGTYYYLDSGSVSALENPPADLGEELGPVAEAGDERLKGCPVYRVLYTTEFTNHMVDGQSVPQDIYVKTGEGYLFGKTYNEKILSRYRAAEVQTAIDEGNSQWLIQTFVYDLETHARRLPAFEDASQLTAEELNTMFVLTASMNTGLSPIELWYDSGQQYVVPVSHVVWRLNRFLEGYDYDPEESQWYDPAWDALVLTEADLLGDRTEEALLLEQATLEGELLQLTVRNESRGVTRRYTIRLDEDSWRYLRIEDME